MLSWTNDRDKFVHLDRLSGGYPSKVSLEEASFFNDEVKANDYASIFPGDFVVEPLFFDLIGRKKELEREHVIAQLSKAPRC